MFGLDVHFSAFHQQLIPSFMNHYLLSGITSIMMANSLTIPVALVETKQSLKQCTKMACFVRSRHATNHYHQMDPWSSFLHTSILMHGKRWFLLSFVLALSSMLVGQFRRRWAIVPVRFLQQHFLLPSGSSAKNVQKLPSQVGTIKYSRKCKRRSHSACMISGMQAFAGLTLYGQQQDQHLKPTVSILLSRSRMSQARFLVYRSSCGMYGVW